MTDAYICDYIRTPIGRFGGTLSSVRTDDLAAEPLKAFRNETPMLTGKRLTMCCMDAPIRQVKTIAMLRAWPFSCPACHKQFRPPPSTVYADRE